MSSLIEITSESDFSQHIASLPPSSLAVIYFHTPWAAPCTHMRTVVSTLASQYPAANPPTISFVSINAEELPDISEEYDVSAVPFVVLVRDGKILESVSGSDAVRVRDAVERYAGRAGVGNIQGVNTTTKANIPPPLTATSRDDNAPKTATHAPVAAGTASGSAASAAASAPTTQELTPEQSKEALNARLSELVKAAPVMLFMKGTPSGPQCGFSRQLVGILRERSVKYGFFNILADEDIRQGLKEFADWPTYPQLWVGGELVGGLDIVSSSYLPFGYTYHYELSA